MALLTMSKQHALGGLIVPALGLIASPLQAGGAAFSPLQLPGLAWWLRSDLGVTTGAGKISQWLDQSGTGDANKNAAQASGPNQPIYNATDAAYNNRPSLQGTGTQWLTTGGAWASPLTQPSWFFAVGNMTAAGGRLFDGPASPASARVTIIDGGSNTWQGYAGNLAGTDGSAVTPAALCLVCNGASSALYVSNSQTAAVSGNFGTNAASNLTIMAFGAGTGPVTGKLLEIIAGTGTLTAGQRLQVFQYFNLLYGVTVS